MAIFFPPEDENTPLRAVMQLLDAQAQILLLINRQLMVVEQSEAAGRLLEGKTFYSLEDLLSPAACRALTLSMEERIPQQFTDQLDGHVVYVRSLPFPPGALISLVYPDGLKKNAISRLSRHNDHITREKLNLILAAIGALRQQPPPNVKTCRYLALIAKNALSLLRESGHSEYLLQPLEDWQTHRETIDLSLWLRQLSQSLMTSLSNEQAKNIRWELPKRPLIACCDAEQIAVALLSLIGSAWEGQDACEPLCIRLQKSKDQVRLSVSGGGWGLSPGRACLPGGVDEIFQGEKTTLSLANRIMANHFGAAFLVSGTEGAASVTLAFPCDLPSDTRFDASYPFAVSCQHLIDRELAPILPNEHFFPSHHS